MLLSYSDSRARSKSRRIVAAVTISLAIPAMIIGSRRIMHWVNQAYYQYQFDNHALGTDAVVYSSRPPEAIQLRSLVNKYRGPSEPYFNGPWWPTPPATWAAPAFYY